jgi:hypothetical protein
MNHRVYSILGSLAAWASPAAAQYMPFGAINPSAQCRAAIQVAERRAGIPEQLLSAIARVESGRRDPATGSMDPWPWTINVEGQGYTYESKAQAIAAVLAFQARGARSIDVGCLQVNLMHHPDAFATLDQAFDPMANAAYAARFLSQLRDSTGDWNQAAAGYHSLTPDIGADYARKVMAAWPEEKRRSASPGAYPEGSTREAMASAWAATLPSPAPAALPFGTVGGGTGGRVAVVLPMGRDEAPRMLAVGGGGAGLTGRGLDSYRANPIMVARSAGRPGF